MPAATPAAHAPKVNVGGDPRLADVDGAAGASAGSRSASYQLQQYETSSRRNDPYVAGYGDHRDASVSLAELDAALPLLQKGATASRL